jgi:hypothetical protein
VTLGVSLFPFPLVEQNLQPMAAYMDGHALLEIVVPALLPLDPAATPEARLVLLALAVNVNSAWIPFPLDAGWRGVQASVRLASPAPTFSIHVP